MPGNIFLAPVAGYSDKAFRSVCIDNGADMCYTEMVSAEALFRGSGKTESLLSRAENEKIFAVQLFGGNAQSMYGATKMVIKKYSPSLIDINCGCPVPKIVKSGAGSALTREPERLKEITQAAVKAAQDVAKEKPNAVFVAHNTEPTSVHSTKANSEHEVQETESLEAVPITVKIRSGWDSEHLTWKEAALAALEAGAKAITIHARTRSQGYEGKSDWNILRDLVQLVHTVSPTTSVFGSGDVFSPEDARRMLETTACDAVMFARGAMGNPFVFSQTKDLITKGFYQDPTIEVKMKTAFLELETLIQEKGEDIACREMRKRFCCYTKGLQNGAPIRSKIVEAATLSDYQKIAELCFSLSKT